MPGLYKDEGVVLGRIKLGEADRIVTIFTRNHGKVRAVAKGVRKTKSRFGGRLEPFTLVDLIFYRGRNLDTITAASVIEPFASVRDDYAAFTAASALAEVVDKVSEERERAWPTYSLLLGGLQALSRGRVETTVPAFMVKLLSVSGYHPSLVVCAGCGDGGALVGFGPQLGGAVCGTCRFEDESAFKLSPDRLQLLAHLLSSDFGQTAEAQATIDVTQALRRYAEYHLERPLRSLSLLAT
ncbi:MAG: DNA repair protein RecO [Actinomycetota bacterium]